MSCQRCTLTLLFLIPISCVVDDVSAQNMTDQWARKTAMPLIENGVAKGLSVGYIEGDHYGIVHLGQSSRAGKPADNLTVYEIGSVSKVFTAILLADAAVRGEIDLKSPVATNNDAGIRFSFGHAGRLSGCRGRGQRLHDRIHQIFE